MKKGLIIFIVILIIFVILPFITIFVKKKNIEKLGNDYCIYNGEHPIETGSSGTIYSVCKGCSKLMKFERRIPHELCEDCAKNMSRCQFCGKLVK